MDPFDDYVQADELEYDSYGDHSDYSSPFDDYIDEDSRYDIDDQANDSVMSFIF